MDSFLGGCASIMIKSSTVCSGCVQWPLEGLEGFSRAEGPSVGLLKPDTLGHYQMSPGFSLNR